jgi:hypothetical protein
MKEEKIKSIIDLHLKRWIDNGLNNLPAPIESEMIDPNQKTNDEWRTWFPIPSQVEDTDIIEIENRIGYSLPKDYITFLKHKHFYELHINEASFCSHPINSWKAEFFNMIYSGYPTEFLIDKGYIPFANWSDWGLLCFNTNEANNNYPIVLWDHEYADSVQEKAYSFYELIVQLDEEDHKSFLNS